MSRCTGRGPGSGARGRPQSFGPATMLSSSAGAARGGVGEELDLVEFVHPQEPACPVGGARLAAEAGGGGRQAEGRSASSRISPLHIEVSGTSAVGMATGRPLEWYASSSNFGRWPVRPSSPSDEGRWADLLELVEWLSRANEVSARSSRPEPRRGEHRADSFAHAPCQEPSSDPISSGDSLCLRVVGRRSASSHHVCRAVAVRRSGRKVGENGVLPDGVLSTRYGVERASSPRCGWSPQSSAAQSRPRAPTFGERLHSDGARPRRRRRGGDIELDQAVDLRGSTPSPRPASPTAVLSHQSDIDHDGETVA